MAVVGRVYNLFLVLFTCQTFAALMTYDFNLTWVYASPDGFSRPVIGINNRWPIPTIEVELGDNVVINVINHLGNQSASLHFHGLFMNGTSRMDGASMITQCPILPEGRFVYNFTVGSASLPRNFHLFCPSRKLIFFGRQVKLGLTGTTRTQARNIPMDFEAP